MSTNFYKLKNPSETPHSERNKQKNFTLIELMLVVSIIAILSTILLPALKNAKDRANQINCTGNLKQASIAILNYGHDSNGIIAPYTYVTGVTTYQWIERLRLLYGKKELNHWNFAVCPSEAPCTFKNQADIYGVPSGMTGNPGEFLPAGFGFSNSSYFIRLSKLQDSGTYMLLTDSLNTDDDQQTFLVNCRSAYVTTHNIHMRHLGKANILAGDGHVQNANINGLSEFDAKRALTPNKALISN